MHTLVKILLHFITSALAGLLTYILIKKIARTKNRQMERMAFALALFASILLHIMIDYRTDWF